ncbi:aldo/keto reductase [candidate division GN15 bacterium]|uniref:Aldo/keto reductase n=1 Tax=candidate division GN15 bacterium TaxID=2072418 RepID=A0A855X8S0_9BACT|nr:MAG: aldo/keto reductase [candidate division GN15 bacterium]
MGQGFDRATLGNTGVEACRLGLSASYWPGKKTVYRAFDAGINFFFLFGIDRQMVAALRDLTQSHRQEMVITTGAYNYIWARQNVRRAFERRLKQLKTDRIDFFLFLGVMKEKEMPQQVVEDLVRLREEGKVRGIGLSTHDRRFAGRLVSEGLLDTFMIRYNAAHRGAELDIFPHLAAHNPTLISYTATRWSFLIRRPKNWPQEGRVPTAPMCYRFVLSNPNVDVCLTAPRNLKQLEENLTSLSAGPLSVEEMAFMREFGDVVHHTKKYFM